MHENKLKRVVEEEKNTLGASQKRRRRITAAGALDVGC
jgi:hypothetical protein